jgi:hypothetical protein
VSGKYRYDAWAKLISHEGSTNQPYEYVGQLGYYTHWQDANMDGMLQLGVRDYDPSVGRFTHVNGGLKMIQIRRFENVPPGARFAL